MLTTNKPYGLYVEVPSDSTVIKVSPGVIQIGSNVLQYSGDSLPFSNLVIVSDSSNKYKNSLLSVTDTTTAVSQSAASASLAKLTIPSVPSGTFPVALFTFFSSDGTNANLVKFENVSE